MVRQLWDIQQGTRKGEWSALMQPVVKELTQDDMLNHRGVRCGSLFESLILNP